MRAGGAGGLEQLDRTLGGEHASAAADRAQVEDRRSDRVGRGVHQAEDDPAAWTQRLDDAGSAFSRSASVRKKVGTHAQSNASLSDRSRDRLLAERDAVLEPRAVDVRVCPLERRLPDVDADDRRRRPHVRRASTASRPTPVPTSRKLVTSERSGCGLDARRDHHRAASQPSRITGSVNVQPVARPALR